MWRGVVWSDVVRCGVVPPAIAYFRHSCLFSPSLPKVPSVVPYFAASVLVLVAVTPTRLPVMIPGVRLSECSMLPCYILRHLLRLSSCVYFRLDLSCVPVCFAPHFQRPPTDVARVPLAMAPVVTGKRCYLRAI